MNIVFYEINEKDQAVLEDIAAARGGVGSMTFIREKLSQDNLQKAAETEVLGVFINSEVRRAHMDAMPKLKQIVTMSTGFDHIDMACAKEKGIAVCNVPAYGSRTVAEFAFALILGLSRKTFAAYREVKDRQNFEISNYEGFNLQGKTIGIVGTGRIGQNAAKIAKGFDMNILAFDVFHNDKAASEIGFQYTSLPELLAQSDIVSIHVPYNKDTHHLINQSNIGGIKKGALLVNTARGEIVETESLIAALNNGTLAGVGIDVLEGERQLIDEWHLAVQGSETAEQLKALALDHALINHPKVAYTPHIAFFSAEAKREILSTTIANIVSLAAGKTENAVQ